MAIFYAAVMIIGAAVSADAQQKAGKAQARNAFNQGVSELAAGETNRALAGLEAERIEAAYRDQGHIIKRKAAEMRGDIIAAQGGSGVVIGEGSAQASADMVDALSTQDLLATLGEGIQKSISTRTGGEFQAKAGQSSFVSAADAATSIRQAANVQANATLINGAIGAASRYYGPSTAKK